MEGKTMKNSKSTTYNTVIFAIAFLAYNVVLFALAGFDGGATFWVSYVFMLCTFASWAICGNNLKTRTNQPRDWLFGFPIIKHCTIYTVIELVASVIFMLMDDISVGIPLALQAIILAVHAVFVVSCFSAREKIIEVQETVKKKVVYIDTLLANIDVALSKTNDAEVKEVLNVLREEVRYSDTMSHDSLSVLESQVAQTIDMVNRAISANDNVNAIKCCQSALQLMKERNARAKAMN
jgi:hypothetical protein